MLQTLLLTGGAGYIGSHASYVLAKRGYRIIILDDFRHNQPNDFPWATVIVGNFGNMHLLDSIFSEYTINAVLHFAASIEVGQSVSQPLEYYQNNVGNTITLLQAMYKHNVTRFIFSSSCAVYGIPNQIPIPDDHLHAPISPYGATKSMVERIVVDASKASNLRYVMLRYFNAAGALPEAGLQERHVPETHIIPRLFACAYQQTPCSIFGTDYPTPDGSAVRDYVHVLDIAQAHAQALDYLAQGKSSIACNLGTGTGYSVLQIIQSIEQVTGRTLTKQYCQRRAGDPAFLVADATRARDLLGFVPQYSDLDTIISSVHISF